MRISTIVSAAAGTALLLSPAATLAAPAPQAVAPSAPSAWMALSMLNASGSVGLGEVAVQPASSQNSPPADKYSVGGVPTPVVAFWVLTVAAMVYLATRHSSGSFHLTANSPG